MPQHWGFTLMFRFFEYAVILSACPELRRRGVGKVILSGVEG